MSVLSDGIGDRDIPGATAKQLVDVSTVNACSIFFVSFLLLLGKDNVVVEIYIVLFCG